MFLPPSLEIKDSFLSDLSMTFKRGQGKHHIIDWAAYKGLEENYTKNYDKLDFSNPMHIIANQAA